MLNKRRVGYSSLPVVEGILIGMIVVGTFLAGAIYREIKDLKKEMQGATYSVRLKNCADAGGYVMTDEGVQADDYHCSVEIIKE